MKKRKNTINETRRNRKEMKIKERQEGQLAATTTIFCVFCAPRARRAHLFVSNEITTNRRYVARRARVALWAWVSKCHCGTYIVNVLNVSQSQHFQEILHRPCSRCSRCWPAGRPTQQCSRCCRATLHWLHSAARAAGERKEDPIRIWAKAMVI